MNTSFHIQTDQCQHFPFYRSPIPFNNVSLTFPVNIIQLPKERESYLEKQGYVSKYMLPLDKLQSFIVVVETVHGIVAKMITRNKLKSVQRNDYLTILSRPFKVFATSQVLTGSKRLGQKHLFWLNLLLALVLAPRVFLRVLRFSSLHKNQHFQNPLRSEISGRIATLWRCHFKFFICFYFN